MNLSNALFVRLDSRDLRLRAVIFFDQHFVDYKYIAVLHDLINVVFGVAINFFCRFLKFILRFLLVLILFLGC